MKKQLVNKQGLPTVFFSHYEEGFKVDREDNTSMTGFLLWCLCYVKGPLGNKEAG